MDISSDSSDEAATVADDEKPVKKSGRKKEKIKEKIKDNFNTLGGKCFVMESLGYLVFQLFFNF